MRPAQADLIRTVRTSLNDTVAPALTDKWARYVATAMDLVLQSVERRIAGEGEMLAEDTADMQEFLGALLRRAANAGRSSDAPGHQAWELLAEQCRDLSTISELSPLEENERLRESVIGVLHWLDEHSATSDSAEIDRIRDDIHWLIRRQVDRSTHFVQPLFMTFGPVTT